MGARLLRRWLNQPLLEIGRLNARLDAVEALVGGDILRDELAAELKQVGDIERLSQRISIGKVGPRDLLGLRNALAVVPRLRALINELESLAAIAERLDPCDDVFQLVSSAINEDPPATLNSIGAIRAGIFDRTR